jgi:hypothetical protein
MIPDKSNIVITRSEEFKSSRSVVASTPAIKKLLRSKVYTNKHLASIREISMNAFDSHVQAGKPDLPIEVTLPSILEPTLRIRDYGIGLNDHGVRNILFSYGDSEGNNDKVLSNDVHGCFHIGAKAPLSYTNAFQVVAIKDNVKRLYTIYIGEDEDDYIDQIGEEITDECNGVEVIIPIKNEDISTFVSTAESLFQFWVPQPKVIGNSDYSHREFNYLIRGEKWAFVEDSEYFDSPFVVMGGVPYALNRKSIPNLEYNTPKYNILQKSVIFYANIGDVNVNAGREELEYTDKTIQFVMSRLELIENEAKAQIEIKFATAKTEFEVKNLYYEFFSSYGSMGSILTEILQNGNYKLDFNGKAVDKWSFDVNGKTSVTYISKLVNHYRRRKGYIYELETNEQIDIDVISVLKNTSNSNIVNLCKFFYFINENGVDRTTIRAKVVEQLSYYLKSQFGLNVTGSQIVTLAFDTKEKFDSWVLETGIPDTLFKNITTEIVIPPPPPKIKKPRDSGYGRKSPADQLVGHDWKEVEIDIKAESGYYVTRFYSNRYLNFKHGAPDAVVNNDEKACNYALRFLEERKLLPEKKIYAFAPKYAEKLDKTKWVPLELYAKVALEDYNKTNDATIIPMSKLLLSAGEIKLLKWIHIGKVKFDDNDPVMEIINNTKEKADEFTDYSYLNSYFGFKLEEYDDKVISKYNALSDKIYRKFPLLELGSYFKHCADDDKEYLFYIQAKYAQLKELEVEKAAKKLENDAVLA